MIAVFAFNKPQYNSLNLLPRNEFRLIKNVDSIRGERFTGIILLDGWSENKLPCDAYDSIKKRQPELFDSDR